MTIFSNLAQERMQKLVAVTEQPQVKTGPGGVLPWHRGDQQNFCQ